MSIWYDITIDCWKLNKTRMKKLKTSLRKFGFKITEKKENEFEISMTIPLKKPIIKSGEEIKEVDCKCYAHVQPDRISFGQGEYFMNGIFMLQVLDSISTRLILDKVIEWIPTIFSSGTIVRTHCECDLVSTGVVTQEEHGVWEVAWTKSHSSYNDEPDGRL